MSDIEKIRELISRSESKMLDLEKAIQEARGTFSSEGRRVTEAATRVNSALDDWDRKMGTHDDNISRLEEKRKELRSQVSETEQKAKEVEKKASSASSEINSTQKEIMKAENTFDQYQTRIETLKAELEKLNKEADGLRVNVGNVKQSNEKEFEDLENAKNEFKEKIKKLSEKQPIAHFLLTEAESKPPEVLIVAELIKNDGQLSMDDFRKNAKTNTSIAAKTIESLEQKGIVSKVDKDTIRLVKRDIP